MKDASARDYKDTLVEALHRFQCCKDEDVEQFLRERAILFEIRGWATTYLLLNREKFEKNELWVEGYFSLTHKAVSFLEDVSKTTRGRVSGNRNATTESFVLIGQLGKYIGRDGTISPLSGKDLLDDAMGIISQSSDLIINRNIMIECKPIEQVKKVYLDYGFHDLQFDEGLHTMYLQLKIPVCF